MTNVFQNNSYLSVCISSFIKYKHLLQCVGSKLKMFVKVCSWIATALNAFTLSKISPQTSCSFPFNEGSVPTSNM